MADLDHAVVVRIEPDIEIAERTQRIVWTEPGKCHNAAPELAHFERRVADVRGLARTADGEQDVLASRYRGQNLRESNIITVVVAHTRQKRRVVQRCRSNLSAL